MRWRISSVLSLAGFVSIGIASPPADRIVLGDASRGEQVIHERGCTNCHTLNEKRRLPAPDLGRRLSRNYSPAALAGVLWNHAATGRGPRGGRSAPAADPVLSEQPVADLYAWFESLRYFERPGDAARGKRIFAQKRCAGCHGITDSTYPGAPPVTNWAVLRDPVAFAQAMWNRPAGMEAAFFSAGIRCPRLSRQELTDLLIYIENLPQVRKQKAKFVLAPLSEGERAFHEKGCGSCHRGKHSLAARGARLTPVEIAAALWNHGRGKAGTRASITYEEMAGILAYVWNLMAQGDPRRGEAVFARKGCGRCHAGGEGSASEPAATCQNGELAPVHIVAAIWNHGPAMRSEITANGAEWPRLSPSDMGDLLTYLEARRVSMTTRDLETPEPSQVAGRASGMPRRE